MEIERQHKQSWVVMSGWAWWWSLLWCGVVEEVLDYEVYGLSTLFWPY